MRGKRITDLPVVHSADAAAPHPEADRDALDAEHMASAITAALFEGMSERDDKVQRISFKGGAWPDQETDLGGMCRGAFERFICAQIAAHANTKGEI